MKLDKIIKILIVIILIVLILPITSNAVKVDDAITKGDDFLQQGTQDTIDDGQLKTFSIDIFNAFLTIGIALAVVIGMYLGVKFMVASAEDKAKVKESLVPYIAGCIVMFGAMGIWKLTIILFRNILA